MSVSRITREDAIEQSVTNYLRNALFVERTYPADQIEMVEAFDEERFQGPLSKNYLAVGFNFDDGGRPLELGSDLVERVYTIEIWCVGRDGTAGRNLANAVRDAAEEDGLIPLIDLRDPAQPVIDHLYVNPVTVSRQPVPDPKPWQRFLWIVHIPVVDQYYLSNP